MRYGIHILSKEECEDFSASSLDRECIIISINDKNSCAILEENEKILSVLRLAFDDIDRPVKGHSEFTPEIAGQIVEFIDRYKDLVQDIVVHCRAGISRSSAVACCIARYLNGDDDYLLSTGRYMPNRLVYKIMAEALGLEYNSRAFRNKERFSSQVRSRALCGYDKYGISLEDMFD